MSVARNTIRGVATAGILLFSYAGTAVIEDNYLEPGPALYPGDDSNFGEGIEVNSPSQGGVAYVRRNQVFCENPQAGGIILASFLDIAPGTVPLQNSVVEKNQVTMHGSLIFGGISIYDVVDHNVVGQNEIRGDGVSAIQVSTLTPGDNAVSNVFNGNN